MTRKPARMLVKGSADGSDDEIEGPMSMQPRSSASQKPATTSNVSPPPVAPATTDPVDTTTEPQSERREGQGPDRRRSVVDRRAGLDRRQQSSEEAGYDGPERRVASDRRENRARGRRRGPGRRRSDDRKAAEEGEMTAEQFEFVMAIETYKKVNKRMYPTWTEVLEVINQLGYRKVMHRDIQLQNVPEPELLQPPRNEAA